MLGTPKIIDPDLQQQILQTYNLSLSWDQAFCVTHHDQSVNLSNSCREVGLPPQMLLTNPKNPHGLVCCFDTVFMGTTIWPALKKMIKQSLPGSNFISCNECRNVSFNSYHYILHCHRYKYLDTKSEKDYDLDLYTQK